MSSHLTRLARNIRERITPRTKKPQRYVELPNGNYAVYHPTKGWRQISGKRYGAMQIMAGYGK